ncbi:hypothetical protein [Rahnella inusitata]|uniref:hypothetical protein n=1 Tax=Rahnella inusitata TaxID=58169 RepID=UPI0039BE143D
MNIAGRNQKEITLTDKLHLIVNNMKSAAVPDNDQFIKFVPVDILHHLMVHIK